MNGEVSELDLRLIRTLLTIVQAGGISAAQSTLHISQPAISSQLSTLESRMGIRLCERGRGGFKMTPKGDQFVSAAKRLLAAAEIFRMEVQQITRKMVGNINIGMLGQIDPVDTKKIALTVSDLRKMHDSLFFHFTELSPALLEEKIINGNIDIGIGYFWHRVPNLDYIELFQENQIAYCSPNHPLFKKAGQLTIDDVKDHEWVWPSHPLPEMPPPAPQERLTVFTDGMDSAALFILSGQHLGFLPEHFATQHVRIGQLTPLNPDLLKYTVSFHAAVRRSSRQNYLVELFLQQLTTYYTKG
ncbi:LysR family transcriptional regulator [Pseudomonas viridiflava]|uniref:LysR family transcriptional regulator n=1 Tax=Pseudomonas viridiflava TaxID=33069 RepID=UPI000F051D48|nr:LysR family transcriptional regulator [Pseudomonas viridiflava]